MDLTEDQAGGSPPPTDSVTRPSASSPGSLPVPAAASGRRPPGLPPPPPPPDDGGGDEDEGMLRMSFLEHLEELRTRLIKILIGMGVAFIVSLAFAGPLWKVIAAPAVQALTTLGVNPPELVVITPMEGFNTIWVKIPLLCAVFLASPWVLYQVWAFISPGLYRRERRWAVPFIVCSAGLFILGGLFAYFVAFRYGLTFLLGIGMGNYVRPMVSISTYSDMFVNVVLGVGLVFELPVLIFFLTLLRVVNPHFLLNHSRYAILAIFILAAVITPTPDAFNMMLFATPMCLLFFVGIFASYLLVLNREGRRFPWSRVLIPVLLVLILVAGGLILAITKFGVHLVPRWPFFTR
jgi:sec-independent protein translocase protein TatC